MGGVVALDVEGRIGLGITQALGFGETRLKRDLLLLHAGEDVIAGSVQDAIDAVDGISGERLAQHLDDRNAAGHRRLEIEADAVCLGEFCQFDTVAGQKRLVRGDDVFSGRERGTNRGSSAGPESPPINSTNTSILSDVASATGSSYQSIPERSTPRSFVRSRAQTAEMDTGRPQRTDSSLPCRETSRTTEVPTVPRPARPARSAFRMYSNSDVESSPGVTSGR